MSTAAERIKVVHRTQGFVVQGETVWPFARVIVNRGRWWRVRYTE